MTPSLRHFVWLTTALFMALLPHVARFSVLLIGGFLVFAFWRLLGYLRAVALPDRAHRMLWLLKLALGLGAVLAVWIGYRGQPGRDAGVALLILLTGMKLIELRAGRDFYVLCCLGYFVVVTNFLYAETIPLTLYLGGVVLTLNAALLAYHAGDRAGDVAWCLRRAGLITLQAIPVAVLAFYLFPRIEGPLWGRPADPASATSGLSDEMSPGTITALSLSDEIAFRVKFHGAVPPATARYWRGPVLWDTDGRTWRAGTAGNGPTIPVIARGSAYQYTVTIEPHGKRWLFALEMPSYDGPLARARADLQLIARYPVRRRLSYDLSSHTDYRITSATAEELAAALALPPGMHPRARALARAWHEAEPSDRGVVDAALRYFNREPFFYTLTPPPLATDPTDEFLFTTRAGFCEHFASSFVVLMRAAGIPARVVTGYQGGEFNPIGDYLIVRQLDAHAWAEVWLADRGWVRIDPTAAVAPERLSMSIDDLLPAAGRLLDLRANAATRTLWRGLRRGWDAVNYRWNQWVIGYTPTRQRQLLDRIGLAGIKRAALAGAAFAATGALLLLVALLPSRRRRSADPVTRAYARFCRTLARAGCVRHPQEGPVDFAARVGRERANLREPVARITDTYVALRYGRARDAESFIRQVKRFTV